ncbi:MAG: amino acid synthesis family protein [Roseovarius sp.]|nr:amino acid synthesis family protein [Roseovarius sp.]
MSKINLRKTAFSVEEIYHEGGPAPAAPLRRAAALAIIENPFSGRYEPDIQWFMEVLKPQGLQMAMRLVEMLGGAEQIEGYGKGAMIGEAGELEHGALWHAPWGYAMRELLNDSSAIVPSSKKVTGVGGRLDVPITHINASYVRSHFDSMEVGLNDAPKANEMVLVLVMSTGPRVHDRAGGLAAKDIKGEDGLR